MAKNLFVLVHTDKLKRELRNNPKERERLLEIEAEINRIKNQEDYVELIRSDDPRKVSFYMPLPTEVDKVFLCGFYSWGCVVDQFEALKKAGYDVEAYEKALFPDKFIWGYRFEA